MPLQSVNILIMLLNRCKFSKMSSKMKIILNFIFEVLSPERFECAPKLVRKFMGYKHFHSNYKVRKSLPYVFRSGNFSIEGTVRAGQFFGYKHATIFTVIDQNLRLGLR